MEFYSVFVTGANRGIGLEYVRQLSSLPKPPRFVFATYRSSESLQALTEIKSSSKGCEVVLIKMDIQKLDDVAAAREVVDQMVGENGLTLLINNAALLIKKGGFPNATEENLTKHMSVNAFGPVRVFQEMFPLLQKAATRNASVGGRRATRAAVLNISSRSGSITETGIGRTKLFDLGFLGYKTSKAALNMAMRVIAENIKDEGILVVNMCPGWVKTDMGTEAGDMTPEQSVSAMLKTLEKLNDSHHGTFMNRLGDPFPF